MRYFVSPVSIFLTFTTWIELISSYKSSLLTQLFDYRSTVVSFSDVAQVFFFFTSTDQILEFPDKCFREEQPLEDESHHAYQDATEEKISKSRHVVDSVSSKR